MARAKSDDTTEVTVEDVSVDVGGQDISVIQYGDQYGLFDSAGAQVGGPFASRWEANEAKGAMAEAGSKGGKRTVEDDDGSR